MNSDTGVLDLSTTAAVWAGLLAALVLAGLHLAAPRIRRLPGVPEAVTGSFAGGLAVAYVFLHLLPEIAEGNESIGAALNNVVRFTPLLDLGVFVVALLGFLVFYGLERLADRESPRGGPTNAWTFRLHLGSFFVYNFLITYTMPLRFRTGVYFAILFTIAMGLHFVLSDRGLEEHYGRRFDTKARALLAVGLLVGWLIAALFAPTSALLVDLLTAFLAGSILLNVFKEEIPSERKASFPWFTVGLALYAGLLALTTYFAEG